MGTSRPCFTNALQEQVASLIALSPNLILKVAQQRLEQRHLRRRHHVLCHHSRRLPRLEDRTPARYRPKEPRSSDRTLLHLHLLVHSRVGHDGGGARARYRLPSIIVLCRTIHPLPPSFPSLSYPKAKVHLPSGSLPIPSRPLRYIRQ